MRGFFSRTGAMLALAALMGIQGFAAPARAETAWAANDDDALLFEARLSKYRLGDGVRGYQTPRGVCLDMADMIMALDVPVRLDKKLRRATGWAFAESNTIVVDRESNVEQIRNTKGKLGENDVYDTPEGWCVSSEKLAHWFGIKLDPNMGAAILTISADKKLPVELAAERRDRAAQIRTATSFDLKTLPQAHFPMSGVKAPSVDVVAQIGGLRQRNGRQDYQLGYQIYVAGEVGPVAYDARLASDSKGKPDALRLRAYRNDANGGLLGPLRATQVAVGDVSTFSTNVVAQSRAGRGAMVTNRPLQRPDRFSSTDFRGELPVGWDAELYRNNELLGFAVDRADGRYEFLDVPMLYGQNRFELVLYGPQGQVKREELIRTVGQESIPPKTGYYWAGLVQDGFDLLQIGTRPGFRGGWRGSVGYERGLDTKTSVSFGLHSLTLPNANREVARRNFAEGSVLRALGSSLLQVSGALDTQGGYVVQSEWLAQFGKTNISAGTTHTNGDFMSDRIQRALRSRYVFEVDRGIQLGRLSLPLNLGASYDTRDDGSRTLSLGGRTSVQVGRYSVTGGLTWSRDNPATGPPAPARLAGTLLTNGRIGRVRVRGELEYDLAPAKQMRTASMTAEWDAGNDDDRNRRASWRAEAAYDRFRDRVRGAIGYVRQFDKFAITARLEGASDGAVAAGLNLSFSLGPDPRKRARYRISSEHLASSGQVLARVYHDANNDGIRQPDEAPAKDVQLTAGRQPVRSLTDEQGAVMIDNIAVHLPVLIGIDASSLPDPLIQPRGPGLVLTPRPGVLATIDLPLTSAGEVDGTLVRSGGGGVEGVDLELIDVRGAVISTTRTDFDGFFLFEKVPYGAYRVRIGRLSAEAARLDPALAGDVAVNGKTPAFRMGTVVAETAPVRNAGAPTGPGAQ